jgi:hypothetical protein
VPTSGKFVHFKELLRKAALLAAEQDDPAVSQRHLDAA